MATMKSLSLHRREFMRFLAASPLISRAWAQNATLPAITMKSPKDAINLIDFEDMARKVLPPAHWGYLTTGVDDDLTLHANREGYKHFQLRPRRLVDSTNLDTSVDLLGVKWDSPIFICPVGTQKAFHVEGETAVARAAKNKKALQILSTMTSTPVEDIGRELGRPPWYQLYLPVKWDSAEKLVKRVEDAGCPVLMFTVDLLGGRNTETLERFRRTDTRDCSSCHDESPTGGMTNGPNATRPMFRGIDSAVNPRSATWDTVSKLKKLTKMKLFLKGIETREDALLAREHGVDGILVSNHGGRATEDGMATIESLPEVIDAVGRYMPVMLDGGVRRGTDVFKALALGAKAVGIGRPYIYGLASFGQPGVERVIDILRGELELVMRECGTTSIKAITKDYIKRA
jgi:isopentenyl diphosphate isomerase/L-lactate dehydrogenase-like FMN-dependent dehydrogenase